VRKIIIAASVVAGVCILAAAGVAAYILTRPALKLPADFVEVEGGERSGFEVRAIAADGTVVGLRRRKNPENGTLKFWMDAVKRELTGGRGYELLAEEDVESDAGEPGKLMKFSAKSRGQEGRYLVALFVTDGEVLVAEAGGKADAVKAHEDEIRKSFLSVR
jgi:hypothetical protein